MSTSRFVYPALAAGTLALAVLASSCTSGEPEAPAAASAAGDMSAPSDPVERGRYLVAIMSCTDCHTPGTFYGAPDNSRFLSGSDLGWVGPWGVVHARNLTPDNDTGIGTWTTADIARALRTGYTPDGTMLAPIMPWMNYAAALTDEDAMAIASYLKTIPPVTHRNLDRIPPGEPATGAVIEFPPPPAWDAPRPDAAAEAAG